MDGIAVANTALAMRAMRHTVKMFGSVELIVFFVLTCQVILYNMTVSPTLSDDNVRHVLKFRHT